MKYYTPSEFKAAKNLPNLRPFPSSKVQGEFILGVANDEGQICQFIAKIDKDAYNSSTGRFHQGARIVERESQKDGSIYHQVVVPQQALADWE